MLLKPSWKEEKQPKPSAEQAYILLAHYKTVVNFHCFHSSLTAQLQVHQV